MYLLITSYRLVNDWFTVLEVEMIAVISFNFILDDPYIYSRDISKTDIDTSFFDKFIDKYIFSPLFCSFFLHFLSHWELEKFELFSQFSRNVQK